MVLSWDLSSSCTRDQQFSVLFGLFSIHTVIILLFSLSLGIKPTENGATPPHTLKGRMCRAEVWNAPISLIFLGRHSCVGIIMQSRLGAYLPTGSHKPGPRLDLFAAQWLPLWDGMSTPLSCCVRVCGVAWHHYIVAWIQFSRNHCTFCHFRHSFNGGHHAFLQTYADHLAAFECMCLCIWSWYDILLLLWMLKLVQWPEYWPL